MGVARFEVGIVNPMQSLTGRGADLDGMGLKPFEASQPVVAQPKPELDMGGMKI